MDAKILTKNGPSSEDLSKELLLLFVLALVVTSILINPEYYWESSKMLKKKLFDQNVSL